MKSRNELGGKWPMVTIAITCYNYGEYVESAIKSALAQTYPNFRVVIYDDGSTDSSLEKIKKFKGNEKLRIVSRENRGVVFTRNQAIEEAIKSGSEFLVFLDADDTFPENYVCKLYEVALREKADVVYGDSRVTGFSGEKFLSHAREFDLVTLLAVGNFINISSLIRVSAVRNVRFDAETEKLTHEDWVFFCKLAARGLKFAYANNGAYINYLVKSDSRNGTFMTKNGELQWFKFAQNFHNIKRLIYEKVSCQSPEVLSPTALKIIFKSFEEFDYVASELENIKGSLSYKIGNAITFIPRGLADMLRK